MTRRALIIANPGTKGEPKYCEGVNKDVTNYTNYLQSAIGGLWQPAEIVPMFQPSVVSVQSEVRRLGAFDYSTVIFVGHGWFSTSRDSTIIILKAGQEMDSLELRQGAKKRTIILDCCRMPHDEPLIVEHRMNALANFSADLNPSDCRLYYDREIERCSEGVVVLYGCSIGEEGNDDSQRGGIYSYNLLREARNWAQNHNVDTTKSYGRHSVVVSHEAAKRAVESVPSRKQHPQIEKPRTDPYFPFCIVA